MKLLANSMGAVHMCLTAFLNFACGHGRSPNDNFQEKKKKPNPGVCIELFSGWCLL